MRSTDARGCCRSTGRRSPSRPFPIGIIALFVSFDAACAMAGTAADQRLYSAGRLSRLPRQALLRGRKEGENVEWKRKERWLAAAGVGALAAWAYFTVFSTEKIVSSISLSKIIGGLFCHGTDRGAARGLRDMVRRPLRASDLRRHKHHGRILVTVRSPLFLSRSSECRSKHAAVLGGAPFVSVMPTLYAAFIWWGGREAGFKRWQVFAPPVVYAAFVAAIVFWVQPFGQGAQGGSGASPSLDHRLDEASAFAPLGRLGGQFI